MLLSLSDIILTLVTNGFYIQKVDRLSTSANILHVYKYDRLGAEIKYTLLFTSSESNSVVNTLLSLAAGSKTTPIIISDTINSSDCICYKCEAFYLLFGGILNTGLILLPNLSQILDELGHNQLPAGLVGKPDDLLELYVKECFQFILESPARRYGKDRSFQSLPDTVVLSKERFMLILDSKAYSNGFSFTADDMRRFKSYVEDFRQRYSMFFGDVLSLVVISGHFADSESAIRGRSDELYKLCNTKISCIKSSDLGLITGKLIDPKYRSSINWRNIFSELIIDVKLVDKEINRINKDNLG